VHCDSDGQFRGCVVELRPSQRTSPTTWTAERPTENLNLKIDNNGLDIEVISARSIGLAM
jgi:hypothetical protein